MSSAAGIGVAKLTGDVVVVMVSGFFTHSALPMVLLTVDVAVETYGFECLF